MMRKTALLVACLSFVLFTASAFAQAPATFVFKSGERLSGDLLDLGCCDYTIAVNGQQRKVGLNDLAVIDFTGDGQNFPSNEVSKILPGQNLLVMRDGQMLAGKFTDVGGIRPKRITFQINGQTRDFSSDHVARIYLEAPPSTSGTSGSAISGPSKTFRVPANRQWTPTGINVRNGETLQVSANGQVKLSTNADDVAQPAGRMEHRLGPEASLPGQPGGALVARVGNGTPFPIGDRTSVTMPASGQLYLGVDDDGFADNSGEYSVQIAQPGSSAAGTSGQAANQPSRSVRVAANRQWVPAGVNVRAGQVVNFSASGEVKLSQDPSDVAQPAGRMEHRLGPTASLPGQPGGTLVARVGNGTPFPIGDQTSVTMPESGPLFLGVDDDGFADNSGEFVVSISPQSNGSARSRR